LLNDGSNPEISHMARKKSTSTTDETSTTPDAPVDKGNAQNLPEPDATPPVLDDLDDSESRRLDEIEQRLSDVESRLIALTAPVAAPAAKSSPTYHGRINDAAEVPGEYKSPEGGVLLERVNAALNADPSLVIPGIVRKG
jgi:hypothetical protein